GKTALSARKFDEALKHYQAALALKPDDVAARDGLKKAQAGPNTPDPEVVKKQEFDRLVGQARAAAGARKFPEAIRHYEDALKLKPNDPEATAALKRAREGKP